MQLWKGWGRWVAVAGRRGRLLVDALEFEAELGPGVVPPGEEGTFLARLEPPMVRIIAWRPASSYERWVHVHLGVRHGHLRRGNASPAARAAARADRIQLPPGYTYVRAHPVRHKRPHRQSR